MQPLELLALLAPAIRAGAALVLPVLVLPFLLRFLVSRLVLLIVGRRHLPRYVAGATRGWTDETDREVEQAASRFVLQRIAGFMPLRFRLRIDVERLLALIHGLYRARRRPRPAELPPETFSYRFSVIRLCECLLLAFGDLYRDYADSRWFRFVRGRRLIWFSRLGTLVGTYNRLARRLPLVRRLWRSRTLSRVVRIVLIPLLGPPSLLWYTVRAVLFGIVSEGFMRFLYALILLRVAYYAPYLYGRSNAVISRRIREVTRSRLRVVNMRAEEMIDPAGWRNRSSVYREAAATYNALLRAWGLPADRAAVDRGGSGDDVAADAGSGSGGGMGDGVAAGLRGLVELGDGIGRTLRRVYESENPLDVGSGESEDGRRALELYRRISRAYCSRPGEPVLYLRTGEALEAGYLVCILLLGKVLATPGLRSLFGRVTVQLVLQVRELSRSDLIRWGARSLRISYRSFKLIRTLRRLRSVLRGASSPVAAVTALASPFVMHEIRRRLRQFAYHRIGRLCLYTWERHMGTSLQSLDLLLR